MHYITFTADGFASFCGGSRQPSKTLLTCSIGFPTVRLPRVFVTTVPHLLWLIEEPNIDDQGFENMKNLFVKSLRPGTSWHMHPNMMGPPPTAGQPDHLSSCLGSYKQYIIHARKQAMIEQLTTSIRTKKTKLHHHFGIQKEPALDVWGGAPKIETEGQPSTLKDLNLDAKNFTENCRNKNEWFQNKFKSLMAFFPQVMYRTLYLLSGPGYWITVSPTLILQVILPVGPKIGTAHACALCKPWMAYVIAKIVFRFSRICLQGPDSLMFHLRRFSTPAYFETNVLKELQIHQKQALNQWESSRNMSPPKRAGSLKGGGRKVSSLKNKLFWTLAHGEIFKSQKLISLHPGRWTAGTYSHHQFFERKIIWTKPPWLCAKC